MLKNPSGPRPPRYRGFMIILRHTTLGSIPLDESSARHTDLYLTTPNTHKRQTSMPLAEFEPIPQASELPQTHFLDSAAIGIGLYLLLCVIMYWLDMNLISCMLQCKLIVNSNATTADL
jgi:hypothetical protein